MNPTLRNIFIAVVVIVVLFFGYRQFFLNDTPVASLKIESGAPGGNKEGRDFLTALVNLSKINLNLSAGILNDPVLARLKDMSLPLPDEPHGRPNPFDSLGNDSSLSSGISAPPKIIITPSKTINSANPSKTIKQ